MQIQEYINKIRFNKEWSSTSFNEEDTYTFFGDGAGDFEKVCSSATKKQVQDYIKDCEQQIQFANAYLKLL